MELIDALKKKYDVKTSEELFGISPQPAAQCGYIYGVIDELDATCKKIESLIDDIRRSGNMVSMHGLADDIEYYLSDIDIKSQLYDLRDKIELIRGWGEEWKKLAKRLLVNLAEYDNNDILHYISDEAEENYKKSKGETNFENFGKIYVKYKFDGNLIRYRFYVNGGLKPLDLDECVIKVKKSLSDSEKFLALSKDVDYYTEAIKWIFTLSGVDYIFTDIGDLEFN